MSRRANKGRASEKGKDRRSDLEGQRHLRRSRRGGGGREAKKARAHDAFASKCSRGRKPGPTTPNNTIQPNPQHWVHKPSQHVHGCKPSQHARLHASVSFPEALPRGRGTRFVAPFQCVCNTPNNQGQRQGVGASAHVCATDSRCTNPTSSARAFLHGLQALFSVCLQHPQQLARVPSPPPDQLPTATTSVWSSRTHACVSPHVASPSSTGWQRRNEQACAKTTG